jgi:hypothetical protein
VSYAVKADLEQVFGAKNINQWADLDNDCDAEKIEDRISAAIAYAENEVDSKLRRHIYEIPVTDGESGTPREIVDVVANLAGVWLYENRGVQDFNPETGRSVHRLEFNRQRAEKTLREILAGIRTLDATMRIVTDGPT